MEEDITVRSYQPKDKEQIVELLNLVFNGWPHLKITGSSLDHWNWKFEKNPTGKNNIAVGEVNDRIIACNHGLYVMVKLGDDVALCRQGVDAAVHPDYRGKGLYLKTDKIKKEIDRINNMKFSYSISENPIILKQRVQLKKEQENLRHNIEISKYIWIKDIDIFLDSLGGSTLRKVLLKYLITGLKTLNRISRLSGLKTFATTNAVIRNVERFDDSYDQFWGKLRIEYRITVDRTSTYMNWRYLDRNGGIHVVKQATEGGEVVGTIILGTNDVALGGPRGYIADLITFPHRLDIVELLVLDALAFFKEKSVNTVEYWVNKEHSMGVFIGQLGFIDKHNDISLSIHALSPDVIKEVTSFRPNEVFFQLGDMDWI